MLLLYKQYKTSLKDQIPITEITKYSPNIKINVRKHKHVQKFIKSWINECFTLEEKVHRKLILKDLADKINDFALNNDEINPYKVSMEEVPSAAFKTDPMKLGKGYTWKFLTVSSRLPITHFHPRVGRMCRTEKLFGYCLFICLYTHLFSVHP